MQALSKIALNQVVRRVPKSSFLPTPFHILNRIHLVWKMFLKYKIYTNRDNFIALTGGHLLNLTLGRSKLLQIAAQCVLICRRIIDCTNQYNRTANAYQLLKHALFNTYGMPVKRKQSSMFGYKMRYIAARVELIARTLFQVFVENFRCSMCLWDTIEALSFSAATRNERIQELFVNGMECIRFLCKDNGALVKEMRENRAILNHLFSTIKCSWSVEVILTLFETTTSVTNAVKKIF